MDGGRQALDAPGPLGRMLVPVPAARITLSAERGGRRGAAGPASWRAATGSGRRAVVRWPVGAGGRPDRPDGAAGRAPTRPAAAGNNHRMWGGSAGRGAGWAGPPSAGQRPPPALKKVIKGRLTRPASAVLIKRRPRHSPEMGKEA